MKKDTVVKIAGIVKIHLLPTAVLVFIAVCIIWCKSRFPQEGFPELWAENGVVDMRGCDFGKQVYHLGNNWDVYYGKLYGPEAFADPVRQPANDNELDRYPIIGTLRVRLLGKPHQWLTICGFSVDYATRIFLNGEEVRNIGYVSDDPEKAVHKGRYMWVPMYTGETGEIELIYQYCNYMHKDGGFVQTTYISSPENIDEYMRGVTLYSLLISSGLIFLMFWFLLTASIQKSWEYAALAFCCLVMAMRNQFFLAEHLLPPDYDYLIGYRLSVLVPSLIPASGVCLLHAFFPKAIGKKTIIAHAAIYTVIAALHFILGTKQLVALCHVSYYLSIPFLCWDVLQLGMFFWKKYRAKKAAQDESADKAKPDFPELLTLATVCFFILMMFREGIATGDSQMVTHFGITPLAMVICVMLLAVAINNRIQQQILALEQVRQKNLLLGQVNDMNRDFLRMVAHELKTPLTVISGYAQLTRLQMERSEMSEKAPERLSTIQSEAGRLSEIVTRLMDYTYNTTKDVEMASVNVKELLNSASAVMIHVCEKNNNVLTVDDDCAGTVKGNFELLLQVMINLIANASRHTRDGVITVKTGFSDQAGNAEPDERGGYAVFTITDTGSGISPEAVPHIFEKGYTTGQGNGIGLSICKDTITLHGGVIRMVSTGPEGTQFLFTVPLMK